MNNFTAAMKVHQDLSSLCWDNNKEWLLALKRIIQFKKEAHK
jgi:hypothetical protein